MRMIEPETPSLSAGKRLHIFRRLMKLSLAAMARLLRTTPYRLKRIEAGSDHEMFSDTFGEGGLYLLSLYELYGLRSDWIFVGTGNPFQFCGSRTPVEIFNIFKYLFTDSWKTYDVLKWGSMLEDSETKEKILKNICYFENNLMQIERATIARDVQQTKNNAS